MIELKDAEERALWDAVYVAAIGANLWDHHIKHEAPLTGAAMTRDEHAAQMVDKALEHRRMRIGETT